MQVSESICSDSLWWSACHLLQHFPSVAGHEKKKEGVGGNRSSPLSSAIVLAVLLPFMPWTVSNSDRNQFKKDLFWVSFIPLPAFVLLHSEWLGLCQKQ